MSYWMRVMANRSLKYAAHTVGHLIRHVGKMIRLRFPTLGPDNTAIVQGKTIERCSTQLTTVH